MKKRFAKKWLLVAASSVVLIAGCGSANDVRTATPQPAVALAAEAEPAPAVEPQVTTSMEEVLPNGDRVPVDLVATEGPVLELLLQKQSDVQANVAQIAGLSPGDVKIMLASIAEQGGVHELACSMVLNTDSEFDAATVERIVDGIVDTVGQSASNMEIDKANIVVTNNAGVLLN